MRTLGGSGPCTGASSSELILFIVALGGLAAPSFSASRREPTFHRGLDRPSLRSVLQRGIAYPWGLQDEFPGPGRSWILTSEPVSPLRSWTTAIGSSEADALAYESRSVSLGRRTFSGWYSSSSFHIRRTVAAIFRASVSFARFGLIPESSMRR